jgi:hypothetical protein
MSRIIIPAMKRSLQAIGIVGNRMSQDKLLTVRVSEVIAVINVGISPRMAPNGRHVIGGSFSYNYIIRPRPTFRDLSGISIGIMF